MLRSAMPPALSPALALAYVRELSVDVQAVVVLDAAGGRLAGDPAVALAAAPLVAARDDRHAVVAACGRFALPGLVRSDLRAALAGLRGDAGAARAAASPGPAA